MGKKSQNADCRLLFFLSPSEIRTVCIVQSMDFNYPNTVCSLACNEKVVTSSVFLSLAPETVTWVEFQLPITDFQTTQLDKAEATRYKCGDLLDHIYCAKELTSCKVSRNAKCLPGWKLIKFGD